MNLAAQYLLRQKERDDRGIAKEGIFVKLVSDMIPKSPYHFLFLNSYLLLINLIGYIIIHPLLLKSDNKAVVDISTIIWFTIAIISYVIPKKFIRARSFLIILNLLLSTIFIPTLYCIISKVSVYQVSVLITNSIFFAIILPRQISVVALIIQGCIFSFLVLYRDFSLQIDNLIDLYNIFYSNIVFLLLIVVIFTKREELIRAKHKTLLKEKNKRLSEDLIRAIEHRERFVYAIDTECIEAFLTLHQIGKDLKTKIENARSPKEIQKLGHHFISLLNQNQHAANFLIETIYLIKDHLKLNIEKVAFLRLYEDIDSLLNKIKSETNIEFELDNICSYEYLNIDREKLLILIHENVDYIIRKKKDNLQPIKVILMESKLEYKVSFMNNYIRKIDALKIIISDDVEFDVENKIYAGNTGSPSIILPRITTELPRKFSENIIDAHYGFSDTIIHKSGITLINVIPKNTRDVRPKVMDIPEMEY